MKSSKKNRLIINENELGILNLIKEGLLGPCTHLMSQEENEEILKNHNKESFPYSLSFTSKLNEELLKQVSLGQELEFYLNDQCVGSIKITSKFENNKTLPNIFSPNTCSLESSEQIYIGGTLKLDDHPIKIQKQEFDKIKNKLNAQKITAIFSSFDPLHRAHERMFRWTIDKADLLVVFLIESYETDGFKFGLKEKYLKQFIQNYLPPERIFVFTLKDLNIFHAHLNPGLESIVAKSLGCTKLVVGQNHSGLGMFYDENQPKSILDKFSKDYNIEVIILPEFVFCDKCRMIVSTRSCPHGNHHHIHYNSHCLKDLLVAGIIPPAIFMRKEVSSIILSTLFPHRFKNIQKLYYGLFPTDGILEYKKDEEFYEKLLELHQMSYMV